MEHLLPYKAIIIIIKSRWYGNVSIISTDSFSLCVEWKKYFRVFVCFFFSSLQNHYSYWLAFVIISFFTHRHRNTHTKSKILKIFFARNQILFWTWKRDRWKKVGNNMNRHKHAHPCTHDWYWMTVNVIQIEQMCIVLDKIELIDDDWHWLTLNNIDWQ